ncbi:MAG: D-alanine--D-alanine ligase [Clostridiales bacterium]|nr:D-alanine--D-alanine ligase [Clostridiales bacterium]
MIIIMDNTNKKTLGIIFGGVSSEHDISCVSAKSIIENIDYTKYNIVLIGITKNGKWFIFNDDVNLLPNDRWTLSKNLVPAFISPDTAVHGIVTSNGDVVRLDVVFPVLHGKNGEDGTVQGLLQLAQIPFVGCDCTSSGVCMDKAVANAVADAYDIEQAKWCAFTKSEYYKSPDECMKKAEEKLSFPIFVKPANAGSSVGITKAHNIEELSRAMDIAFGEDKKAVLEEFIDGFEVECAVLGNDEPVAGEVGQIVAAAEFYDYDAKYNNPQSQLYIPAQISSDKRNEVKEKAIKAYKSLGCEGMARVDFFVTKNDGRVLLNEINTIPGQTEISMYPKLFEAAGLPYAKLIDRLIDLAMERGGRI